MLKVNKKTTSFISATTFLFISFLFFNTRCSKNSCVEEYGDYKVDKNVGIDKSFDPEYGYKICFVGDTGVADGIKREKQQLVANAMADEYCDEVRILGDVIYEHGLKSCNHEKDSQYETKFKNIYQEIIDQGATFKLVMGNHDYKSGSTCGNPNAWICVAKRYDYVYFPNFYYAEKQQDGLCIISVDTNVAAFAEGGNGWFDYVLKEDSSGQQAWLSDVFNDFKGDCQLTIAVAHHPLYSPGTGHGDAEGKLKEFIEDNIINNGKVNIDFFIAGHDHILSLDERNDTIHIVSGAGGKLKDIDESYTNRSSVKYAASEYGYAVIQLYKTATDFNYTYKMVTVHRGSGHKEIVYQKSTKSPFEVIRPGLKKIKDLRF